MQIYFVAPRKGAWIEVERLVRLLRRTGSPSAWGAWIEVNLNPPFDVRY